jgi:oligopeptide transport system substrate-binding protein
MYVRMKNMPDSPERNRLFLLMSRQMEVDGAWKMGVSRYRNVLVYPQVKGYRYHPILVSAWEYMDLDRSARKQ